MGLVKTRRLMAMRKQQRAKAGMNAAGTGPAKPLKNGPFVGPVPKSSDIGAGKRMLEAGKLDIGAEKLDIEAAKLDIDGLPKPTQLNIEAVFKVVGTAEYFKRSDLEPYLDLSLTAISNLLESMLKRGLIERVAGHGKGAYRWSRRT